MHMPLPLQVVWFVALFVSGALEQIAVGRTPFLIWIAPAGLDPPKDQPKTDNSQDV